MLLLGNESDAAGFVTVLLLNVFKCILILCFNNAADQHNCANLSPSLAYRICDESDNRGA